MKKINYKLINLVLILVAIFLLYKTGYLWMGILGIAFKIIFPFLLAFAVAYAFYPMLVWLRKKKFPKWLGVTTICLLILGVLTLIVYLVSTILVGELSNLFGSIIDFAKEISEYEFFSSKEFSGLIGNMDGVFDSIMSGVGNYVSNGTVHLFNTSLSFFSNVAIGAAAFIYFLIDMDKIRAAIRRYFKKKSKKTFEFVKELDFQMRKYITGLLIIIVISMVEYGLGYAIIGHPYALLLAFLAGVGNLIPYFGGIIVNCVATITAFVISPKLCILTIIVFVIGSTLDSYVINPLVYGKTNSIPPLFVIFSLFAGGILFGLLGVLISFPLAILIVTIYRFYKDDISDTIKAGKKKLKG